MESLMRELRFAWRRLLGRPGFATVAVLTVGVGVGANSAIFSVVEGILLRPLPYPEAGDLVRIWEERPDLGGGAALGGLSSRTFEALRSDSRSFEQLAIYQDDSSILKATDEPQQVAVARVTASVFPMLRATAQRGRVFERHEETFGAHRVAVVSDRAWRRRMGGDAAVVGRTVTLDGEGYTVVGVMPPSFEFPDPQTEVWIPYTAVEQSEAGHARRIVVLPAVARLRPGTSTSAAEAEGETLLAALRQEEPRLASLVAARFHVESLREQLVAPVRPALLALSGAVGLVLLIACANVANLLLVRSLGRQREIAVSRALGAGRGRLILQALSESLLLALFGGIVGIVVAALAVEALVVLAPKSVPRLEEVGMSAAVVAFDFGVALFTGLLFGLAPAIQGARHEAAAVLRSGGDVVVSPARGRRLGPVRSRTGALTVIEVALSLVLLTGAGLLIRSFVSLVGVDPGYRPERVLTAQLQLPEAGYPDQPSKVAFVDELLERLRRQPQVRSAGAVNFLPLNPSRIMLGLEIEGYVPPPGEEGPPRANLRLVSPGYFRTMGIELVRGRDFAPEDGPRAPGVVVINEALAERFFSGREALGARIRLGEIVGIVENVRHQGLSSAPAPTFYVSYRQAPPMMGMLMQTVALVVHSDGDPFDLVPTLRAELHRLDADLAFGSIDSMENRLGESVSLPRFYAALLAGFAAVALLLAAVGLFGVLSFSVRQRTRETGIRVALGARAGDVMRLVVAEGMTLVGLGVVVGLAGAVLLSRLLESLLYGVDRLDPLAFGGATALLVTVAALACLVPAVRATRLDPVAALRSE